MNTILETLFQNCDVIMGTVMEENLQHSHPEVVKKVKEFPKKRKDVLAEINMPNGKFNVIIHNDAWTNNFMYR